MKIYEEKKADLKNWCLKLCESNDSVFLCAVDSEDGFTVCCFIEFKKDGKIWILPSSKRFLTDNGYNPEEHGNNFDSDGKLVIVNA